MPGSHGRTATGRLNEGLHASGLPEPVEALDALDEALCELHGVQHRHQVGGWADPMVFPPEDEVDEAAGVHGQKARLLLQIDVTPSEALGGSEPDWDRIERLYWVAMPEDGDIGQALPEIRFVGTPS